MLKKEGKTLSEGAIIYLILIWLLLSILVGLWLYWKEKKEAKRNHDFVCVSVCHKLARVRSIATYSHSLSIVKWNRSRFSGLLNHLALNGIRILNRVSYET
jgi:hypothetical protein